ncbi:homologous recombination OB-fold protein [Thalassophryne amazonica]|uniref:homologous recombination OB-fold protein n=1 Tax=Thalassophryne amazonica TaxID=390379 RepID=UPI001471EB2B|nr:homologous recombination OB-fold protein [Thalassophryne amazonica]
MTCKLSGLFSIAEDFDDEDLLETEWIVSSASKPAGVMTGAGSPCALRASSVAQRHMEKNCLEQTGQRSPVVCNGTTARSSVLAQPAAVEVRQLSVSPHPPALRGSDSKLAPQQSRVSAGGPQKPSSVPKDDFDDWDIDLAELEECDRQVGQSLQPPVPFPSSALFGSASSEKKSPACGAALTLCGGSLSEPSAADHSFGSSHLKLPSRTFSTVQSPSSCPIVPSRPQQSPVIFRGLTATTPTSCSKSHQQPQRPWATPGPCHQSRGLFETVSPAAAAAASSALSSPSLTCRPLHMPVLTNRLVQLVSASTKLPRKRPCSDCDQPRTRRFPGPAGLLPQQPQGQSLDDIIVSVPQTPAHGAVARLPSQGPSSQSEEYEFSGGAWAAMKAEMGLDERNPSCFLYSYSVVMVLRKAALKQLSKNKVPNMAVVLKSIVHTHTDAKAVFKDPTGEIQGTVHRRLLEDRLEDLKVGAVLLLKQVGVFSPSHRNHYLNVTTNNLLKIYAPDGVRLTSNQLPLLVLEPELQSTSTFQEPVSRMQLEFDDDEGQGQEDVSQKTQADPGGAHEHAGKPAPQDTGWDADDDLDELLGELPMDTYSL